MRRVIMGITLTALGAAACLAGAPAGASAALTHGAVHAVSGSRSQLEQSSNWSGVAVTSGGYTRVTGSWVVPAVNVTRTNRYAADWVGVGGHSSQDLTQSGTSEESVSGRPNYYAWTEILPAAELRVSGFAVADGATAPWPPPS